jgi:hypothetical protein
VSELQWHRISPQSWGIFCSDASHIAVWLL